MKAKRFFAMLGVSFAMVLGAVGALKYSRDIKEAKAEDTTVYCKCTQSWWTDAGAAVAVHYWGGSSSGTTYPGVRMTAVSTDTGVWKYDIPDDVDGFMFVRVNGSGDIADWGAKTSDLSFEAGKNLYTITSSSAVWGNPGVTGSWSSYVEPASAPVFSFRVNEGGYEELVENNATEVKTSSAVSLSVGDLIYFKKDGVDLAVAPKDDDQLTRVVADGGALRVIQDYNDYLYLNTSSNKLWAGQYTFAAGNYLVGGFNGWGVKESVALPIASRAFAANEQVKAVTLAANASAIGDGWINVNSVVSHPNGAVVKDNETTNAKIVTAGTYSVSVSEGVYTFTKSDYVPSYKLLVGENEIVMEAAEDNQYVAHEVDLTHGTHISYKEDGSEVLDAFAKVVANNNLTSLNNVIVNATDVDVYVNIVTHSIWVGGLPNGGYHLLINAQELEPLTHTSDFDGYTQYGSATVNFALNDTIEYIDCTLGTSSLPVIFHNVDLESGGMSNKFEIVAGVLTCTEACTVEVYLKLSELKGNKVYLGAEREEIELARNYANGFLTAMATACKQSAGYIGVVKSEVVTAWNAQASAYAGLAAEVKAELQKGDLSTVQEVKDFASAYAGIFVRRGAEFELDEFMEWGISSSNSNLTPIFNNNNQLLIFVGVAFAMTLAGAGLYLFLKKRKAN